MKWLLIVSVVLVCGCGPSYCNTNSPDYNYSRCQEYQARAREAYRQIQMNQMQMNMNQMQNDIQQMRFNQSIQTMRGY